jgi:hypothetical protein
VFTVLVATPRVCAQDTAHQDAKVRQAAMQAAMAADHRKMLEQLGIRALRPGPSANENAANAANYGDARANRFPNLRELLAAAVTPARICGTNRVSGA